MPLGFERLNVRKQPPNKLITFISPLDGPDKAIAQDFLERVAAIVYPIMRDNGLTVMSLDEFPTNKEFWGRNFNAGECIQLVLKNPNTGLWLPFQFVQGVMIHELAHIKQMNHSRAFWSVNNKFSAQLRTLRSTGYTGEGFWSAGRVLISSECTQDRPLAEVDMPNSLCGGTYRTRTRTRKNRTGADQATKKPKLTYAEVQQRKKERKFGTSEGNKVGADEDTRVQLEKGVKVKSAPKVAKSVRGRELRAAAALKRFETQAKESPKNEDEDSTDYSDGEDEKAIDVGGGKFLVPVSKGEDGEDEEKAMKNELMGLAGACGTGGDSGEIGTGEKDGRQRVIGDARKQKSTSKEGPEAITICDTSDDELIYVDSKSSPKKSTTKKQIRGETAASPISIGQGLLQSRFEISGGARGISCSCCSVTNEPNAVLCMVCSNVLEPDKMENKWKCLRAPCKDTSYINAGDAGICGVCGQRKQT
ncbi:uncharacterized protein H6S33_006123 [Morchella sextelata]|uniref:uncharacterized protein n=1 Tax=Morchella sextelata TaxID=1174677 RepID=UPI001D046F33|nr:uncharacterized protein H6S33_006123 [Morchella sextelata]KAH0614237.1 hypothetical protein H6S33_006123 [Morchella sextelata]